MPLAKDPAVSNVLLITSLRNGKYRLTGTCRHVYDDGTTTIEPVNGMNLTSVVWDAIDFVEPGVSVAPGDTNQTRYSDDYSVDLT